MGSLIRLGWKWFHISPQKKVKFMSPYADLHIHTNKSDSTFSPEEVVLNAVRCGLSAIGITDHDSVEAIPLVERYAKQHNIEVIPGIELSADADGEEVHILGYYIDFKKDWFLEKLEFLRDTRTRRAQQIIGKLNELAINITIEDVLSISGEGAVGRMHIARALLEKKYILSIPEAFQKYIGKGKYAYVKKYRITPKEAIDMIGKLGGISVLAHPQIMNQDDLIPQMVKQGLGGIEVYHSDHTPEGTARYLELAKRYNLAITGGSDCHGMGKGKVLMGTVKVPYELVEELKNRCNTRKISKD